MTKGGNEGSLKHGPASRAINPYDDARRLADLYRRFEHALKRGDHMKQGRKDAQADWKSFATSLGEKFFEDVVASGVADTLINDPPRKLMADLTWQPEQPPKLTNVVELFVKGVCQVRHSYIHGEKFMSGGDQRQRDATLVHEALGVLRLAQSNCRIRLA
jgi:hypothetical protein